MKKAVAIIITLIAICRMIATIKNIGTDINGENPIDIKRSTREILTGDYQH